MNNKLNISNRLRTIGDFINSNDKVVDIGCDHALLDIYLYLYKTQYVIASDINDKPLKEALKNLQKYNLVDKIPLVLSSGLEKFKGNEFNTLVIAGMGGMTIIDILMEGKNKLFNTKKMVIQSNRDIPKLRSFISKLGYKIEDEVLIKEKKIIYTVVLFKKTKKKIKYNKTDILVGPILKNSKDTLFKEFINTEIEKRKKAYISIPKKYILKRINLKKEIRILKNVFN